MKILTVLVCVHSNNKLYDELLIESLKSLEKQTFKNFETVIVLDECWENTEKKILSEITLDYKLYHKEKKQGLSYAKNYGLSKINTDLVCFLDADDLYLENKLEKQLEYLKNNDVDFLGTHALNRVLHNEVFFNSCFNNDEYLTHDEIKNKIFDENIMVHGSMMIKKSALDTLGGYNDVKGMEDWDLWKRAISEGFIFNQLSERLYVYTLNTSIER